MSFVILIRDRERGVGPFDSYEEARRVIVDTGILDNNHVILELWPATDFLVSVQRGEASHEARALSPVTTQEPCRFCRGTGYAYSTLKRLHT